MPIAKIRRRFADGGLVLAAGALLAGEVACLHMRSAAVQGIICGVSRGVAPAHCAACYAAILLAVAAAACLLLASAPQSRPIRDVLS